MALQRLTLATPKGLCWTFALLLGLAVSGCTTLAPKEEEGSNAPSFPTSIEVSEFDYSAIRDELAPLGEPPEKRNKAVFTGLHQGGFTQQELQWVLRLRTVHGEYASITTGRMVPAISDCVNRLTMMSHLRQAKHACLSEHTAMIVGATKRTDPYAMPEPDFEAAHHVVLLPRQPLPQTVKDQIGEPSQQCSQKSDRHPQDKLLCTYYPMGGTGLVERQQWLSSTDIEQVAPDLTGNRLRSATRPFASAADRAYEEIFVRLYQPASHAYWGTQHALLPGRFLPAVRACGVHYSWVGRNFTGNIKLEDFLVLVREIMPTDMGDDETLDYMPNMPVVLVSLIPQATDGQQADLSKQENCFVDPRDDTVFTDYSGPTPLDALPQQQKPAEQDQ